MVLYSDFTMLCGARFEALLLPRDGLEYGTERERKDRNEGLSQRTWHNVTDFDQFRIYRWTHLQISL